MAKVQQDRIQLFVEVNGKQIKNTIKDLDKEYRALLRTRKNLQIGSDEYKKTTAEAKKLKTVLDEQRNTLKGSNQAITRGNVLTRGRTKGTKLLGTALKAALAPLLGFLAVSKIFEWITATASLTQEYQKLREEINLLTGETGAELSKVTAQTKAIAKTFDQDVNEVIRTANANSKALGISFGESLDLIEKGLLATGSQGDEFLEQIREYSVQLNQVGFNAEQAFSLVARGIQQGVFNDKAVNSIKEFNLRIKDLSAAQRQVLEESFGKAFSDELVKGVESGEKSTVDALKSVVGELNKFDDKSAQTTKVLNNLFGPPSEEAVGFILTLGDVDSGINALIDSTNVYIRRQGEQLELEKQLSAELERMSLGFDGTGSTIKQFATGVLADLLRKINNLIEFIRYLPEELEIATSSFPAFVNALLATIEKAIDTITFGTVSRLKKAFNIDFRLEIPEETLQLEKELQEKKAADRAAFEEEQQRQALAGQKKNAEAQRLAQLRQQKQTQEALRRQYAQEAEKMAKMQLEADRAIEDLRLSLMEDGVEKEIETLRIAAVRRVETLKGSQEQIAEQTLLIYEKLNRDIEATQNEAIRKEIETEIKRSEQRITVLRQSFEQEVQELERQKNERIANTREQVVQDFGSEASETDIIEETNRRTLALQQEFANEKLRLIRELNTETQRLQEENSQKAITSIETEYLQRRTVLERELQEEEAALAEFERASLETGQDPNTVTQEVEQRRLVIKEEFQRKFLALESETNTLIEAETLKRAEAALSSEQAEYQERLAELEQFKQSQALILAQETAEAIESGVSPESAEEDLKSSLLGIERQFLQDKQALQEAFGIATLDTQQALADQEVAIAEDKVARKLEQEKKIQDAVVFAADAVSQIGGQLLQAQAQADQRATQQRLQEIEAAEAKEIKLAGNNAKKKEEIERKFQKQKDAVQKEAAKKEQARSIVQVIIDTAASIAKTSAQVGYPAAIPFVALAAATGAIQLATITSQTFAEGGMTGLTDDVVQPNSPALRRRRGRFSNRKREDQVLQMTTRDGVSYYYDNQRLDQRSSFAQGGHITQGTIGVIGEKGREWVAPNWMVEHPVYGPELAHLEAIRTRGFADGGLTVDPASLAPSDDTVEAAGGVDAFARMEVLMQEQTAAIREIDLRIDDYKAKKIGDLQDDVSDQRSGTVL